MDIEVGNNKYKIIKDYRDAFDKDLFLEKYTDFFDAYDYIVGDWAYGKLRLKGFYEDNNKKSTKINNKINDYSNVDDYIKNNCAYDCRYFILEKMDENNTK